MLTAVEAALLQRCEERARQLVSSLMDAAVFPDPFSWALLYLALARGGLEYQRMFDLDREAGELAERVLTKGEVSRFANHDLSGALLALYVAETVRHVPVNRPALSVAKEALLPHFSQKKGFFDDATLSLAVCLGLSTYAESGDWLDLRGLVVQICPQVLDPLQFFLWSGLGHRVPGLPSRELRSERPLSELAALAAAGTDDELQPVEIQSQVLRAGLALVSEDRPSATDVALFSVAISRATRVLEGASRQELMTRWTRGAVVARLAAMGVTLTVVGLAGLWFLLASTVGVFDADNLSLEKEVWSASGRLGFLYASIWGALGLATGLFVAWKILGIRGLASDALLLQEGRSAFGRILRLWPILGTVLLEGALAVLFLVLS